MKKTRKFYHNGIAEYDYKLVSFGYTELIIICASLSGTYAQVYKLDQYSIHEAMAKYHDFVNSKK